ncbi:MAG: GntR family transcriptional regulator [Fimbriimonadaceae bacterium]|nr:GntR family transcriptional regulator [Fimbriimonadaceae bacterium]
MSTKKKSLGRGERNSFKLIAGALQGRVESGAIPLGRYLPTERELQEEFGVSRSTVRRALAMLVEEGWAQNLPNRGVIAGAGVTKPKTNNIALIDDQTFVLRVLYLRISEMLRARGYHLVHVGGRIHYKVEDAFQHAVDCGFAGALVWSFRGFPDAEAIRALSRRLPTVAMDHRINGVDTDLVTFDYFNAAYQATSQLAKQGRTRIAVTGMLDMLEVTHQRFSGYMKAIFDHGLQPVSADYQFVTTSGMGRCDTTNLARRLMDEDRPDAIFVMQDSYIADVVETILECGLKVPADVAVTTIGDDVDLTVDGIGMTTVAVDWDAMAELSVQMLLDRIERPDRHPEIQFAPQELIVRGLCGAPPSDWTARAGEVTGFHGELPYPRSQYRFVTSRTGDGAAADSATQSGGYS